MTMSQSLRPGCKAGHAHSGDCPALDKPDKPAGLEGLVGDIEADFDITGKVLLGVGGGAVACLFGVFALVFVVGRSRGRRAVSIDATSWARGFRSDWDSQLSLRLGYYICATSSACRLTPATVPL